jgi:DNA-binding NarL/FixJ family response regulator
MRSRRLPVSPEVTHGEVGMTIRIVLAMKEPLLLAGVDGVLSTSGDCVLCASTTQADGVMPLLERERPDVLVLDKQFEHDQPGLLERLHHGQPDLRMVMYVHHTAQECLLRNLAENSMFELSDEELESLDCCLVSLRAGAKGCVPKGATADQLLTAVRAVMIGEIAAAPWLGAHFTRPRASGGPPKLSPRQLQIVRLVARGFSNKAIARELGLREQTVKNHLARASRSLGKANRLELALYALQQTMLHGAQARRPVNA